MSTALDFKDIRIRKSEFLAKIQFLYSCNLENNPKEKNPPKIFKFLNQETYFSGSPDEFIKEDVEFHYTDSSSRTKHDQVHLFRQFIIYQSKQNRIFFA